MPNTPKIFVRRLVAVIIPVAIALTTFVGVTAACSSDSQNTPPTPRAKAYPRLNTYPAEYRLLDSVPYRVMINRHTTVSDVPVDAADSRAWNIAYPRYGATIHLTVRSLPKADAHAMSRMIDGRLQRMSLNIGASPSEAVSATNPAGVSTLMLTTGSATPTPVQILATDSASYLLSAGVYINFSPSVSATDSLAPVISALRRDMSYMLQNLRP